MGGSRLCFSSSFVGVGVTVVAVVVGVDEVGGVVGGVVGGGAVVVVGNDGVVNFFGVDLFGVDLFGVDY